MNGRDYSRREVLRICGLTAAASAICPALCARAAESGKSQKPLFRFAVASDIHFAQKRTPFAKTTENLISWLNDEKSKKGLDAIFLNGDLVHDSTQTYEALKSRYLKRLNAPYYAIKGNHDFVDAEDGSPGRSWKKVWGYRANHVVKIGNLAFILADTSAPMNAGSYLPADIKWLKKQLALLKETEAIFVLMHIAQRKRGVKGWPKWGLGHNGDRHVKAGEAVMTLLESHKKIRAVFHGHNHNSTGRHVSGETPYFFDSHIGGSFGNRKGYRIVEIRADSKMSTYQYDAENGRIMNQHSL